MGRHSPTAVPPRNGGGAGVKPSVLRHATIDSATLWPQAIPLATDDALSLGIGRDDRERGGALSVERGLQARVLRGRVQEQ